MDVTDLQKLDICQTAALLKCHNVLGNRRPNHPVNRQIRPLRVMVRWQRTAGRNNALAGSVRWYLRRE